MEPVGACWASKPPEPMVRPFFPVLVTPLTLQMARCKWINREERRQEQHTSSKSGAAGIFTLKRARNEAACGCFCDVTAANMPMVAAVDNCSHRLLRRCKPHSVSHSKVV